MIDIQEERPQITGTPPTAKPLGRIGSFLSYLVIVTEIIPSMIEYNIIDLNEFV